MMSILNVVELLLFPKEILSGIILSLFFTVSTLYVLFKKYEDTFTFTKQEKIKTYILSFLFMIAGTVVVGSFIPLITWAFFAFQFIVDRKYMYLPDKVTMLIGIFSFYSIFKTTNLINFLQNGILTAIILFAFFLALAYLGPMGGGDIKLMGAAGLYFTLFDIPSLLFFGFLIGAMQGIGLMITNKAKVKDVFAFGPALILGILATVCLKGGMFYV